VFSTLVCPPYDGCFGIGNLAVMDPETRSIQNLPAAIGFSPAWAPSGDVIAFVGCCDSLPQLYLTRPDGSTPVRLLIHGIDGADQPAWSPDGLRIAFRCFFATGHTDVCVVNKDGTGLVRLMIADFPFPVDYRPAWSPDGRSIAFTWGTAEAQIAVMTVDGGSLRLVTGGAEPAWSRDGAKLVFVRDDGLFEIDADGSNLRRLTTGHHIAPAWRP
jgi:Tol biopolymer transport system component